MIKEKYLINLHLIFSLGQAIIASSIKSDYICPLIGRLDDIGHDAVDNLNNIIKSYKLNASKTQIMGSSIRKFETRARLLSSWSKRYNNSYERH